MSAADNASEKRPRGILSDRQLPVYYPSVPVVVQLDLRAVPL